MDSTPCPESEGALCRDISGRTHPVPPRELVDRTSVYGDVARSREILLVEELLGDGTWDLPGGAVEHAALLPWTGEGVAPVAPAVIHEALRS